jgi:diguanylate cyclase (GGDEF)-like protein
MIWCESDFLLYIPCLARCVRWEGAPVHLRAAPVVSASNRGCVVEQGIEGHIPLSALRPLHRALTAVNAAIGLDATLKAIVDGVATCTSFQDVALNMAQDDGDLVAVAVAGSPQVQTELLGKVAPKDLMEKVLAACVPWGGLRFLDTLDPFIEAGIPVHIPPPTEDDDPDRWRPEYFLGLPMRDPDGALIGLISVDSPSDGKVPPQWMRDVLEMFAEQADIAILNARRHDEAARRMYRLEREREALHADVEEQRERAEFLRHQARHDALTGLANPIELRERLVALLVDQVPLVVIFCDLDHFKEINDTRGHPVGDMVLRLVADRLRAAVRVEDMVARVGGDEFVVVAGGLEENEALALLDRIDQAFAHPISVDEQSLVVRVSIGHAYELARPENTLVGEERAEELLSVADRHMYARKRSQHAFRQLTAKAMERRAPVSG